MFIFTLKRGGGTFKIRNFFGGARAGKDHKRAIVSFDSLNGEGKHIKPAGCQLWNCQIYRFDELVCV